MSAISPVERFSKWIKLKIYQFEVTYSVYMLTPGEKFFIYSLLFLLSSLTTIAVVLYLPQNIAFVFNRAWFYMQGDSDADAAAQTLLAHSEAAKDAISATAAYIGKMAASAATVAAAVEREL